MNKKIVICSSMKFKDLVFEVISKFERIGLAPLFPNISLGRKNNTEAINIEEKRRLALEHYEAIREAKVVYFILPKGYMGTSCKLELGYALALKKDIYFSEPANDIGLDCYVKKFIGLDNLEQFIEELK